MNENKKIIVHKDKLRGIIYTIGSLLGIIMYFYLIFLTIELTLLIMLYGLYDIEYFILITFGFIIGFIGLIYFVYITISLITRKKMLIVDEQGITDNSTYAAFGFVPWNEIEKIYIDPFLGMKMIELKIKNEEKYLNNYTWWKKELMKLNKIIGHQPFCIGFFTAKVQPEEILQQIQELFEQYTKT
jgi:hypothetical protein